MQTKLLQLEERLQELETLANEIRASAAAYAAGGNVQPHMNIAGQRWYRGARELMVQHKFSGLDDFDLSWSTAIKGFIEGGPLITPQSVDMFFREEFRRASSLLTALVEELKSRELPVKSQLSFAVSAEEFERASELLDTPGGDETIHRAGGVVARVALERHLWTVIETRGLAVHKNPPTKRKEDTQDLLTTLVKANVLTAIQKTEFDGLFAIGNNCAHPKEKVHKADVERLISRGRALASVIL